jgi:hypothetical protein
MIGGDAIRAMPRLLFGYRHWPLGVQTKQREGPSEQATGFSKEIENRVIHRVDPGVLLDNCL